jgi:hypothetical protein
MNVVRAQGIDSDQKNIATRRLVRLRQTGCSTPQGELVAEKRKKDSHNVERITANVHAMRLGHDQSCPVSYLLAKKVRAQGS